MPAHGRVTGRTPARPAVPDRGQRGLRTRLRSIVEPVVNAAGYDLDTLSVSPAGRRQVVRVVVDGDDGVNLDTVAALSRELSTALDAAERAAGPLTAGEYTLEVSSPGVDRPLTLPRHWRRNTGRLVAVRAGERQVTGRVLAVGDDGVRLDVGGERLTVPYAELGAGRVQLDFTRVAELGDGDEAGAGIDDDADEAGMDGFDGDELEEDKE